MKKNYRYLVTFMFALLISNMSYGQNIKLSLANAQNTNDGAFDYYEADITIQTIGGQDDFKLGSGQFYLNYNTDAFGMNIYSSTPANNKFEVVADYANGYFLGEKSGFTNFYNISPGANNTNSRVSWDFSQGVSSGAMTETIGTAAKPLVHIKIKYIDINQNPMVSFEADEAQVVDSRDQFYTACGPFDSPDTNLDCSSSPNPENENIQFMDADFDSSEGVLSTGTISNTSKFSVFPNPSKGLVFVNINKNSNYLVFDMLGKQIIQGSFTQGENELQLKRYDAGVYFLKVINDSNIYTKKIVIE